ncbi:MAG: glycosyltransferase family 87 protein [Chloroflexales bacterium]
MTRLWKSVRQASALELVLLLVLGALLLAGAAAAVTDLIPPPTPLDFSSYYLAAQAVAAGQSPYDSQVTANLAAGQGGIPVVAYLYPPIFAVLLRPLAGLPLYQASLVWLGLNLLWLALAVVCIARLAQAPNRLIGPMVVVALLTPAVHHTLELGQVNILMLLLISAGALAIGRESRGAAWEIGGGGLLATASCIKLFPAALLLVLIAHRRLPAMIGFIGGALLLALAGVAWGGGVAEMAAWATGVLPRYAGGFATPNNQSVEAAISRLFSPVTVAPIRIGAASAEVTLAPLVANAGLGIALGYAAGGIVVIAGGWALLRRWPIGRTTEIDSTEYALLLATILLALPLVWYHYYTLLLLAYGAGIPHMRRDSQARLLFILSGIAVALQRYWRLTANLGSPLLVSFGTIGVGLLWLALARVGADRDAPLPGHIDPRP